MVRVIFALIYTALLLGANAAAADVAKAQTLQTGEMRKLLFHPKAQPVAQKPLVDLNGAPQDLSPHQGQWVVLNFWATWCAPCRKEMPSLDKLALAMQGRNLLVLTVATGPNPVPAITAFIAETDLKNITFLRDPTSQMARAMGVMALPVTLLINPQGQEVGRLIGDADWAAPNAIAFFEALTS